MAKSMWLSCCTAVKKKKVLDGNTLDLVQDSDFFQTYESSLPLSRISEFYNKEGCIAKMGYSEEIFSEYLPVLEDFSIKLVLQPQVGEKENSKFVNIPKDMFVEETVYVSIFDIGSDGNANPVLSAETMRDIYLEYGKDASGTIAVYVFSDETATNVIDEIMITY